MKTAWLEFHNNRTGRNDLFCIDGFPRILIGSAPHATVRMEAHSFYSREHAAVTRINGRWQVADLGSANGIFMNEKQMKTARWLDSGDRFYASEHQFFRFTEEEVDPRFEAHAARLAAGDDSEAAWLVFSDALQELGNSTGQRMLSAAENPVLPLGLLLERMRGDSTVTFSCQYGFARSLTIRNQGLATDMHEWVIDAVLGHPLMKLLRVLELDVASFGELPLQALAAAVRRAAPPSLRVVRLLGVYGVPPRELFNPRLQVEAAPI